MNLRQYLIFLAIGTAIAVSSWCVVLITMNPLTAGSIALVAFYITLCLGLVGLFTISGTMFRAWRFPDRDVGGIVHRSFRQAIFLSILLVGSLYLMALGRFSTLAVLVGVLALGFLEFFFLVSSPNNSKI